MVSRVVAIVGCAIVSHIVEQMVDGAVGTVAADGACKAELVSQSVGLDILVGSQRHGASLRETHADGLPVILQRPSVSGGNL